jgi:hypothetical protein
MNFRLGFKLCLIAYVLTTLIGSSWAQALDELPDAPHVQSEKHLDNRISVMFVQPVQSPPKAPTFHWKSAATQTFALLAMEQSFRMVQQKTRDHLGAAGFSQSGLPASVTFMAGAMATRF